MFFYLINRHFVTIAYFSILNRILFATNYTNDNRVINAKSINNNHE
jgi:hypothetical protein